MIQFLHARVALSTDSRNFEWAFVGAYDAFIQLQNTVKWTRLPVTLVYQTKAELPISKPENIVVDDINSQSPDVIKIHTGPQSSRFKYSRV